MPAKKQTGSKTRDTTSFSPWKMELFPELTEPVKTDAIESGITLSGPSDIPISKPKTTVGAIFGPNAL